ncbi:ABC transporter substrate-binding protein [Magnetococcus marinus]|uniref:ABC transporter substrate-binding protein n=1 Tax=Magnetococcus marinus TaxID=1124597 RepID=UPI00031221A5|nr:ABC transporter substrate-binding protein [Magnetococcus marinus]
MLIAGCDHPQPPFRVGTNIWIGYESLYLAESLDAFKGSPIRLVTMPNTTQVMSALRAGMLEAAATTLDEAISMAAHLKDLRVVLVFDVSHGADVIVSTPNITTLAQLRGRRIGVESGAVGAILLNAGLEAAGLTPADVQIKHLTVDEHAQAFLSQQVDAVVTFEPVRSQLLDQGANLLFDSSKIPGRIVDVLITTERIAHNHPETLRRLINGHFQALIHLKQNPEQARQSMTTRQRLPMRELEQAFQGIELPDLATNHHLLQGEPAPLLVQTTYLVKLMQNQHMLDQPVDMQNCFTANWLPQP